MHKNPWPYFNEHKAFDLSIFIGKNTFYIFWYIYISSIHIVLNTKVVNILHALTIMYISTVRLMYSCNKKWMHGVGKQNDATYLEVDNPIMYSKRKKVKLLQNSIP